MRDFKTWLEQFRPSIADYKYYTNFENAYGNIEKFKLELNMLNRLLGSKNIEADFRTLVAKHPECLRACPLLLAKRESMISCTDMFGTLVYDFANPNMTIDQYVYFMRETGLFELLENHITANLYDYALGINVGLDSNARKNRGGFLMEKLCEQYIAKMGLPYERQIPTKKLEQKTGLNLSALTHNGQVVKQFDFVIYGKNTTYVVETNFYASSGSKLNETARSYKTLALEAEQIDGLTFIWITDGQGWLSSKNNLKETFDVLPTIYNIAELEQGCLNQFS